MYFVRIAGGDSQRDDCTNGFMSIDRIHALMNQDRVQLDISVNSQVNSQALAPGMNFACSGIFTVGYLEQSGMDIMNHSLSYRYGEAMEIDPIPKLGVLQSWLKRTQHNSMSIHSLLPCPFKKEIFWNSINQLPPGVSWN